MVASSFSGLVSWWYSVGLGLVVYCLLGYGFVGLIVLVYLLLMLYVIDLLIGRCGSGCLLVVWVCLLPGLGCCADFLVVFAFAISFWLSYLVYGCALLVDGVNALGCGWCLLQVCCG